MSGMRVPMPRGDARMSGMRAPIPWGDTRMSGMRGRGVGRPGETLTLGGGEVVPSIDQKPPPARTEIGVQLELHDA
jgi:hypothetical protein